MLKGIANLNFINAAGGVTEGARIAANNIYGNVCPQDNNSFVNGLSPWFSLYNYCIVYGSAITMQVSNNNGVDNSYYPTVCLVPLTDRATAAPSIAGYTIHDMASMNLS